MKQFVETRSAAVASIVRSVVMAGVFCSALTMVAQERLTGGAFSRWAASQNAQTSYSELLVVEGSASNVASGYSSSLDGMPQGRSFSFSGVENDLAFGEGMAFGDGGGSGHGPEFRHYPIAEAAEWRQPPLSRIGLGTDISFLGIGVNWAMVLNHSFDVRVAGSFYNYTGGRSEADGFNIYPVINLDSIRASIDWYIKGSPIRISPGVMLYNGNQATARTVMAPRTELDLGDKTFWSSDPVQVPTSVPFTAKGNLNLHPNPISFTLSTGFNHFVPRSNRHWSYPFELGVVFMGTPTINVTTAGWICSSQNNQASAGVCTDVATLQGVGLDYQNALNAKLASWRKSMKSFTLYPIFSYGVMYSFNIK